MTVDQRILIVDAAHQQIAAAQFPSLLVLGNKPTDDATLSFKADTLAGKTVYLWCHYAALLAEELAGKVPDLGIVNGDKTPMSFQSQPGAALAYLRTNVRRYRPPTSKSDPCATPDNIAAPEGVQAVVEAVKPTATVTPITEARTKAQAKAQPNPADDYAPFADDAMARAFTAAHPELRYVARWGKWLAWGDAGWQEDTTLQVYDLARQICCSIADATRGATPAAVSGAKSAAKVASVEKMAKS